MNTPVHHILIADDDEDDRLLFADVLNELDSNPKLSSVRNGEELMALLTNNHSLPDLIFLDLNMPLKNGIDCLKEIRQHNKLNHLPIIIFSTSAQQWSVENAYKLGANLFVRKPDTFRKLKSIIEKILSLDWQNHHSTSEEDFLITG